MPEATRDPPILTIDLPAWSRTLTTPGTHISSRDQRMDLAIALARENVRRRAGGPFGAAVFEIESGILLSVGVNSVVRLHNSTLHAEVVALMFAQQARGAYSLAEGPACELVTSCEPCAMCLGATLWSGVRSLVCGATKPDAEAAGFDEGPVDDTSYRHLESRGITVARAVRRDEAAAVLREYARLGGAIYNP
jgi:tRNA(Arg) A34 adenosine deaminase TadA